MRFTWLLAGLLSMASWTAAQATPPHDGEDGALQMPAINLPPSSFLSDETKAVLQTEREEKAGLLKQPFCGDITKASGTAATAIHQCETVKFLKSDEYARLNSLFKVRMTPQTIGGVYTEVFVPQTGIAPNNVHRVLINVHGGGFLAGARTYSKVESVPVAATGRIKVVSIDYRQGPEFTFPAASDDVEAVYRELLKTYKPMQIGIFGCSAGGLLVAESVARIIHDKLPTPGAVGMLCEGGGYWQEGDSGQAYKGVPVWSMQDNPYFRGVSPNDPLAFPVRSPQLLAKFPPSLLISATRDFALSSTVNTHSRLVAHGVETELHVWEGLGHGFFYDPRLPESREVYNVIVRFFDKHLAR